MSGSMAPDPPARSARRGHYLRLGLMITIGSILANGAPQGLPGHRRRSSGKTITCYCGRIAGRTPDGKYACSEGHITEDPKEKKKKKAKGKGKK